MLQEHVIDPNSTLNDPGQLLLPNKYAPNDRAADQRFVCWLPQGHGNLNIIGAIAQSCDVYFYQVGGGNPAVSPQVLQTGRTGHRRYVPLRDGAGHRLEAGHRTAV